MATKTTTQPGSDISQKAKQLGTEIAEDARHSAESKRDEWVGLAQHKYHEAKQKAQETAEQLSEKKDHVKQAVGHQMRDYNRKLQETAEKLPGNLNDTVPQYPWIAITVAFVTGFVISLLIFPRR